MQQKFKCSVQKKQKKWYSGKKKRHTVKFQVSIHYLTGKILGVCCERGSIHNFKIFKKSIKYLNFKLFFMVDKGYLGIEKLGFDCLMPFIAKKRKKLAPELKDLKKKISRRRIGIEHVFGRMKFFKILSCAHRNRRKRMNLRFSLLAGIYNLEWAKDQPPTCSKSN